MLSDVQILVKSITINWRHITESYLSLGNVYVLSCHLQDCVNKQIKALVSQELDT